MRHVALVVAAIALSACLSSNASAQGGVQRDAQGIVVLTEAVAAAGGLSAIDGIQDVTSSGNITFYTADGATQGTATVYGKGLYEFRVNSALSAGTQSFIVNQGGGELVDVSSNPTPVMSFNLMTAGSLTVPAVRAADALNDTTIGISYIGQATWNGAEALQVHVTQVVDPNLASIPGLGTLGQFDLYIDSTSYQIVGLSESIWPPTSFAQPLTHVIQFGVYSTFSGIAIPTSVSETVNGQQTWSMTLTGAQFNTGLQDSLFSF